MADRTFTEGEAYALVNEAVARETAAEKARVTELEGEKTALQNRIDVLETEKAAEAQRADVAEKAFTDFKDELEAEKAREARRTERLAQVADVAPALEITDERSDRIVAMEDEAFASYLADLREVAAKAPADDNDGDEGAADKGKPKGKGKGAIPRESAAFRGSGDATDKTKATVRGVIGARRSLGN